MAGAGEAFAARFAAGLQANRGETYGGREGERQIRRKRRGRKIVRKERASGVKRCVCEEMRPEKQCARGQGEEETKEQREHVESRIRRGR